jgi:hypothetical protein
LILEGFKKIWILYYTGEVRLLLADTAPKLTCFNSSKQKMNNSSIIHQIAEGLSSYELFYLQNTPILQTVARSLLFFKSP